jgi:hypothetical protein
MDISLERPALKSIAGTVVPQRERGIRAGLSRARVFNAQTVAGDVLFERS